MILIGIDDTDTIDSPGTNQLAKSIVRAISNEWRCLRIVRHQLFFDPRVPYTSKNGSASIAVESRGSQTVARLTEICQQIMLEWFVDGSDPGLCVAESVPSEIIDFGLLCKQDIVTQQMARELAARHNILLRGLGGTDGGVIGSLAAVGLAVTGDDGRVVQHGEWPDDLSGEASVEVLRMRDVAVVDFDNGLAVHRGIVDVGRHLRPNRRSNQTILFVRQETTVNSVIYRAVKLT